MNRQEQTSNLSEQNRYLLEMTEFLSQKGWVKEKCSQKNCGREFFTKRGINRKNCNRYECTGYSFLERKTKKAIASTKAITNDASEIFSSANIPTVDALHVINTKGSTLFIGTCGQYFDDTIFYGRVPERESIFLAQPAIRLQGESLVGQIDGFSTSFINLATEQLNASVPDHLKNLDLWMDFLSSQGIFMGDITLSIKYDRPKWGDSLSPLAVSLKINYLGLEIGIANYFSQINSPNQDHPLTMSDISFGLERLAWAINKTPSYFDIIGPLDFSLKGTSTHVFLDRYRTATLMASSGVTPSNKDRGSKLRMMVKDLSVQNSIFSPELVRYYYQWWSQFTKLPNSLQQTTELLRRELYRNVNIGMSERLKASHKKLSPDIDSDSYLRFLLEQGLVTFDQLRRLFDEGSQNDEI